jgi:hypothetical protein
MWIGGWSKFCIRLNFLFIPTYVFICLRDMQVNCQRVFALASLTSQSSRTRPKTVPYINAAPLHSVYRRATGRTRMREKPIHQFGALEIYAMDLL